MARTLYEVGTTSGIPRTLAGWCLAVGLALAATAGQVSHAQADLTLEIACTAHQGADSLITRATLRLAAGKVAYATVGPEAAELERLVFRGDLGELWIIRDAAREYHVLDHALAQSLHTEWDEAFAKMEKLVKELPAEERSAIQRAIASERDERHTPVAPDVRATDETKALLGYECRKSEIFHGDEKLAETWTASADALHLPPKALEPLVELSAFLRELQGDLTSAAGVDPSLAGLIMGTMEGLPLKTRVFDGQVVAFETRVTSFDSAPIDSTRFEVPRGYARTRALDDEE